MVMIVLLLKPVVEDYIRHIGPFDFLLEAVPVIADEERRNRPTGSRSSSTCFTGRTHWCPIPPATVRVLSPFVTS
jgi:hypothetical protein